MPSFFLVALLLVFGILVADVAIGQKPLFQLLEPKITGIKFSNNINETENLNVLAYEYFYNGGGVAVGDLNNDGLLDVFFTANMQPNKLYLNLGGMKFKDITKEVGASVEGRTGSWKTGVTMADVNGDGLLDIYVCYSGKVDVEQRRNQLFINRGNLQFVEQAKEYGLDDAGFGTQAAFFDFDNDDDLDMYLLNHSNKKIDNMELAKHRGQTDEYAGSKLFENRGGHFEDLSQKAGIHQNPLTFGLGIAIADINKDGWQDIYVTNDYNEPDYLYINNKNGTFSDQTNESLRHMSQFSMGVDIADFNNDALPDIITLDMLPEDNRRQKLLQLQENYESFELMLQQDLHKQYMRNMLHLNNGDGTFSEIAQLAGVSKTDWSWSPLFADFDNDGYKDLFITTGYLRDYTNKDFLRYWGDYKIKKAVDREPMLLMDLIKAMPVTTLPNYIYRNSQNFGFTNMQKEWGLNTPVLSNGAVYADLDSDGDLDLLTNNINENAFVYQNNSREKNNSNYVAIALKYKGANINAVGAKVYLYGADNKVQYQEVNPNRGYLSCVSTVINFGLGSQVKVDSIKIIWPDQTMEVLTNVPANQKLTIAFKEALPVVNVNANKSPVYFSKAENIINYQHENFAENDFKRQLLMLFMYSKTGPVLAKADVNKDGLEDLFVSGDKNKAGTIYIQQKKGGFKIIEGLSIGDENVSATSATAFFDANGDGWPDLYIAKGGYSQFLPNTPSLQDELYLNTGKGHFILAEKALPDVSLSSKSCVRPYDYDGDGDIDLFVGGRVIPGSYPIAPNSFLLTNNGKGNFEIATTPFDTIGMVTDAQWTDVDNDGRKDLVIAGEMMPLSIMLNTKSGFVNKTSTFIPQASNGFWFSLALADVDADGKEDIVAGNLGSNTQIQVSENKPAELYYSDFDGNGSIDPFFNYYIGDSSYPFVSRDELNEQIYPMRRKFNSYKAYADAKMKDIITAADLANAGKWLANEARTMVFFNKGDKFVPSVLPLQAQFAPITKTISGDFTDDGNLDLLLLGNHSDNRLKIGSIDANYGCLLAGDGKGSFKYLPQGLSGFSITGDVKSAEKITISGKEYIAIGVTGKGLVLYKKER